jgi:hypothetical protein
VGATLATAGALALGSTAIAGTSPDTVLEGATSEGVKVKLTVAGFGNATAFRIGKTKVACAEGGTLTNRGGTYREFDTWDPGKFADRSRSSSANGGFHFKTKSTIRGKVRAHERRWKGLFKLVTKVLEHGEKVDTCKLKTRWTAGAARAGRSAQ